MPDIQTTSFAFLHPYYLYALIPVALLFFLRRREGSIGSITFGSLMLLKKLGKRPGGRIGWLSLSLLTLGLALGIIALARPQRINEQEFSTSSGIDMVIAFDLSGSMKAPDMVVNGRYVSRLIAGKLVISDFVQKRSNDRFGLVGFAARPKVFSPLTLDHAIVQEHIRDIDTDMMDADGTAIGSAIAAASTRLEERKETKSKVIVLVTDGASNSGELTPLEAAQLAKKLDIRIYTIALGTEDGRVPGLMGGKQEFDEETLKEIAKVTGGEHFRAQTTKMFVDAFNSIDKLEKTEAKRHTVRRVEELFPLILGMALALAALGLLLELLRPRPAP